MFVGSPVGRSRELPVIICHDNVALTCGLACDPKRNSRKTLVCASTNLDTLQVATLHLIVDRCVCTCKVNDFSVLCDFKFNRFCTVRQIALWCFAFLDTVFPVR